MVICKVKFLDGAEVDITIADDAKGQDLFDTACKYANIYQTELFGLVHKDLKGSASYNWWVRMNKKLKRQIPGKIKIWSFAIVVKFYPTVPNEIKEEEAKLNIIHQIRQDLLLGKTTCPTRTMAVLTSYWLQSEYGDWARKEIDLQLADAFRFVLKGVDNGKIDIDFEQQMMELHKSIAGMSAIEADNRFLKLAASLDHYGLHFYPAYETANETKDNNKRGDMVVLGIGNKGIHRLKKSARELIYTWKAIRSVSFKRENVILKLQGSIQRSPSKTNRLSDETRNTPLSVCSYSFEEMRYCKVFWKSAIEHHIHYRTTTRRKAKMKRKFPILGTIEFHSPVKGLKVQRSSSTSALNESNRSNTSIRRRQKNMSIDSNLMLSSIPRMNNQDQQLYSSPHKRTMKLSSSSTQTDYTKIPKVFDDENEKMFTKSNSRQRSRDRLSNFSCPVFSYDHELKRDMYATQNNYDPVTKRRDTSMTSTSGEEFFERLSDVTENTDILCSPQIVEKTFSYNEPDGVNSIASWLEIASPLNMDKIYRRTDNFRSPPTLPHRKLQRTTNDQYYAKKTAFERGRYYNCEHDTTFNNFQTKQLHNGGKNEPGHRRSSSVPALFSLPYEVKSSCTFKKVDEIDGNHLYNDFPVSKSSVRCSDRNVELRRNSKINCGTRRDVKTWCGDFYLDLALSQSKRNKKSGVQFTRNSSPLKHERFPQIPIFIRSVR